MLRGYVQKYDAENYQWLIIYPAAEADAQPLAVESVNFTDLERRIGARFQHEHGQTGMRDDATGATLQADSARAELRRKALSRIDPTWSPSVSTDTPPAIS